jgi:hypothetical protein
LLRGAGDALEPPHVLRKVSLMDPHFGLLILFGQVGGKDVEIPAAARKFGVISQEVVKGGLKGA